VKCEYIGRGDGEWCDGVCVKIILETWRCGGGDGVERRLKAGADESIRAVKMKKTKLTKQTTETRHISNKYLKYNI